MSCGDSSQIHWQRDVLRPVEQALHQLLSFTYDGHWDYLLSERDWVSFGDLGNRLMLGVRGLAARPQSGVSFAKWYELLTRYRTLIKQMPQKEQASCWFFLACKIDKGWHESDTFRDAQLNEVQPDGKRLQGYLPPETLEGGAFFEVKRAIKHVEKR